MNNNILEIYLYGDSLGLPRARDGICYSRTYAELFRIWNEVNKKDKRVYLHNRSQGAIRLRELIDLFQMDFAYFGNYCEKIMILHCGIVDCSPRPIPDWLRDIVSRLPNRLQTWIIKFLHNNRSKILKSGIFWRATTPRQFKWLYKVLLEDAINKFSRLYIFNILPTTDNIEAHSPGLTMSIEIYNKIIKEIVNSINSDKIIFIDVNKLINEKRYDFKEIINNIDGHHITEAGHELFFNLLVENEKKFIK